MMKSLITSAVALALVAGAAAPAAARPRWGGGYGHYHRGGGDTFGNILLGAVIGGGLIAVASSASKNKASVPSRSGDDQRDDLRSSGDDAREVASMCTSAVERMANGPVSSVDSVGRAGEDGWKVDGTVRGDRGDRQFLCEVNQGQIESVRLRERYAAR